MNGVTARRALSARLHQDIQLGRAHALVTQMRPKDWKTNPRTGLLEPDYRWRDGPFMREVDPDSAIIVDEDSVWNQKTNVGCVFAHTQVYGTSPGANGLNYIALSNDSLTENASSTTLSTEIASNGLTRHIGTVTLPTGSGTSTTVAYTFTATGAQSAQKAALFTASSSGTMNHALAFASGKTLANGDTLAVTFTITLS